MYDPKNDQRLADRLFAAVIELNAARQAALDAGLDASVASFRDGDPFVGRVRRVIPATVIDYPRPVAEPPPSRIDLL